MARLMTIPGLWWLWLAVLVAAITLTLAVEAGWLPDEAGAVREVQSWPLPGQTLSDAVRLVTGTAVVVVGGLAIALLHWLMGDRLAAVVIVIALVALLGLQTTLKEAVDRPRPSEAAASIDARASQTSPSFPAGHVMGPVVVYGWAVYVVLRGTPALRSGRKASKAAMAGASPAPTFRWVCTGALLAVLALTGIVNVWLGVHWPTDVLGGYLWGAVLLVAAVMGYEGMAAIRREARGPG
jgi:undecaprenyl-diphosphatase